MLTSMSDIVGIDACRRRGQERRERSGRAVFVANGDRPIKPRVKAGDRSPRYVSSADLLPEGEPQDVRRLQRRISFIGSFLGFHSLRSLHPRLYRSVAVGDEYTVLRFLRKRRMFASN